MGGTAWNCGADSTVEPNLAVFRQISWIILSLYRGIHVDVIVYIFAHSHTGLRTEGNTLDMN